MEKPGKNLMKHLKKIKINKIFLILVSTLFISSICYSKETPERIILAMMKRSAFADKMHKKYKVSCYGSGGGYLEGLIQHVDLSFEIQQDFDIDTARQLIKNVVEDFVKTANEDKELALYFCNQKCTHKNLGLSLSFFDKRNKEDIALVINAGKYISYSIYDSKEGRYINILREEYESDIPMKEGDH
jgi:hypothetical protein